MVGIVYGLDPNTDLSALHTGTLTFVGLGEHQLQLAFSGAQDCSISIEGAYRVTVPDGEPSEYETAAAGSEVLLRLLGQAVIAADVPEAGTVRVTFEDGSVVEVLDSSSHYESYQLNLGGREIVV